MGISDPMFNGDLQKRVTELERQLRNITSGRRLEDASVGARGIRITADANGEGGALTVDGGVFRSITPDGVEIIYTGPLNGSRVWKLAYDDGPTAVGTLGNAGAQFVAIWDHSDNLVFSTDAVTSTGLARPYLNYRLVPAFDAQGVGEGSVSLWPSTTNTSATKLMTGINPVWHPRVSVGVQTSTIGGGAVAWRLDINGVTAASGSGSGSQTVVVPGWGTDIQPGNARGFDLYAWCTGGATRGWIQCDRLYGTQS